MKNTLQRIVLVALAPLFLGSCASLYLKDGKQAYREMQYQDAIWYLEKGLAKKEDPEGRRMLSQAYLMTNDVTRAKENYALTATFTDNTDDDRINYGRSLMANGAYQDASAVFEGIVSRDPNNTTAKELLASCKKLDQLKKDSLYYHVQPLAIPGGQSAFSAVPYNGGIIFSAPSTKGDKDPYTNKAFTDLYFSRNNSGSWSAPEAITELNSKYHDAVASVSPDGKMILFTRTFSLNGVAMSASGKNESNTQIYLSRKQDDGKWGKPELLSFNDTKSKNAHPAFSSDGQTLFFSSDRAGGQGGMDIWSVPVNGGQWGTPTNMGASINTKGNEVFPAVLGNDTLYFSSDSHKSLGKFDILYTTRQSGSWSDPTHVSFPINSNRDDFTLIWNEDRKSGYFTSARSGNDLIYKFTYEVPEVTLRGLVTGETSKLPLGGAKITVQNLTDGTSETYYSDGNGVYEAKLLPGKEYKVTTELEGYFNTSDNVNTRDIVSSQEIQKVTELKEVVISTADNTDTGGDKKSGNDGGQAGIPKGIYDIPNIYWDYNKWDIRKDAEPYLDQVVKLFRDNQQLKFEIHSHTDCRGSHEYNDDLSNKRAAAVVDYLVKHGVNRGSINSKGFGERKLLNGCTDGVDCTEDKHQQNRRTEFIVTGKKKEK